MATRRPLDWTGPRNLTGGDGYTVDLGMINLRDAAINGASKPLVPYADGRLIKSVRFTPGGTRVITNVVDYYFVTPNTAWNGGFACATTGYDTLGILVDPTTEWTDIQGTKEKFSQILDTGPLVTGFGNLGDPTAYLGIGEWEAGKAYCIGTIIIDPAFHAQNVSTNGVTGSTIPEFSTEGGTTNDGSVVWQDLGFLPDEQIHAIAEVIEGISPMPPYPATLEWIAQPEDVVAGEPMGDITVILKDQRGDPYSFLTAADGLNCNLAILGTGTLTASYDDFDPVTGLATISGASIAEAGTGYVLRAIIQENSLCNPIFSDPFDVTAP